MCAGEGGLQSVGRFAPSPVWLENSLAPTEFLTGDSATCPTPSALLDLRATRKLTKWQGHTPIIKCLDLCFECRGDGAKIDLVGSSLSGILDKDLSDRSNDIGE